MTRQLQPPAGYSVRPATMDDVSSVAEMLRTSDVHDWGQPDITESELQSNWRQPGLDLATDTWLVHHAHGEVAAYAWLLARREHTKLDGWGDVHPAHRGRGVGTFLLDLIERRAMEHRAAAAPDADVDFQVDTTVPDEAVHRMLEARGFQNVRQFWRMDVDLQSGTSAGDPPVGIAILPFVRETDDRVVHAAITEAFQDHWGSVPRTFEEWSAHRLDDPSFDPSLWFVAWDGDQVAGALIGAMEDESLGWVHTIGVRRPWRGRGIAESLVRHLFAAFAARGADRAGLGVDSENDTGATRLYERIGMRVTRRYDSFSKVLPAPRA